MSTQVLTKRSIAFFDFDGTITKKDTLFDFIRYYHGRKNFILGMLKLMPWMVLYLLGAIPNWKAKEKMISYFFKGIGVREFRRKAKLYAENRLPQIIKYSALARIHTLLNQGTEVVVVSASAELWLEDWCQSMGVRLIGTHLEIQNGLLTGKLHGRNCHGIEKVRRIHAHYDLENYSHIQVYGDTSGDRDMIALGHQSFYRHFK